MLIRRTTIQGVLLSTIVVDVPSPRVLVLRPCFYCGQVEVLAPQKFCCNAHRKAYCVKRIALLECNA